MLQILAGDSSDLFNRALMNAIPYAPSIITAWVSQSRHLCEPPELICVDHCTIRIICSEALVEMGLWNICYFSTGGWDTTTGISIS